MVNKSKKNTEVKRLLTKKKPSTKNGSLKSGKETHAEKQLTPEEAVNEVLSDYFSNAKNFVKAKEYDFSKNGIQDKMYLVGALFLYEEIKNPSEDPPWFGQQLMNCYFPTETVKVSRTGEVANEPITVVSHMPRPEFDLRNKQ